MTHSIHLVCKSKNPKQTGVRNHRLDKEASRRRRRNKHGTDLQFRPHLQKKWNTQSNTAPGLSKSACQTLPPIGHIVYEQTINAHRPFTSVVGNVEELGYIAEMGSPTVLYV
ncbi:hypothetical protein JTE90_008151 [Oedothorax gibbosus]|uniref:Uncharacterized protein n=1 Tax=Oedothorax gibbosus TaxID=931172 RepID=A0AAV6VH33_9ARAC|nr:hypothetical protein JTE90_008151 [Oedothorax gibbosus]